eukprot:scaffold3814_cov334-Prasinococcus_capsulatus_cf.AAC.2
MRSLATSPAVARVSARRQPRASRAGGRGRGARDGRTEMHVHDALVPAADDGADANHEGERLPTGARGVKLRPVLGQRADVVCVHHLTLAGAPALALPYDALRNSHRTRIGATPLRGQRAGGEARSRMRAPRPASGPEGSPPALRPRRARLAPARTPASRPRSAPLQTHRTRRPAAAGASRRVALVARGRGGVG